MFNLKNYEEMSLEAFGITGEYQCGDFSHYRWGWLKVYRPDLF